jgi:nitroreductase
MSGEPLSKEELYTLFEAARWAPSSYNNQPWIFVFADRESEEWATFLDLLYPANRQWADKAGVLIVVLSRTLFYYNNKPSRTHSFDTGAALENLALQGYAMDLVVHGLEGFDYDKAREVVDAPQEFAVEAMFAIGKPGPLAGLSQELQSREKRSDRKPIGQFVFKGLFGKSIEQ